ncbi:hypothetical protein ANANG_G00096440 [Anguilla anguilla]|uniref:Bridge-like lipid transfer protein family member 1 N-terminal domain-containing protein n=1 Tax=Anguilla anguilla TaxID=7936 RepID=A0A9D3S0P8_ANGAN|nr:hypothetical protein ANANG_G00096440 [Anguilla anguilla]
MLYRTLLEAEMLAFHVNASYPRDWNMPQSWQCEIEVYKATYHFIYAQKNFFTDLIQDWASDSAPDIYSFVPYAWKFKILFHQFEMIWAANQHNWIDCSTKQQENVYLAACGETLNIDFTLPFNEFVPTTCNMRFCLRAEDTDLQLSLPECHPSRYPLLTLAKDYQPNKLPPRPACLGEGPGAPKPGKPRWRNITHAEAGWVDCWTVPNFTLIIDYTWHPIYPQKADEQLKQTLSEMEESMLSALRPPEYTPVVPPQPSRAVTDPSELTPDRLHVEMELSPDSQITLYGPLLRALVSIKENYFGEDDMYTDFEEAVSSPVLSMSTSSSSGWTALGMEDSERRDAGPAVHPLTLRPWDITVLINLYKVHGRLPVHCSSDGPEGPTGYLERLCFEMKKGYKETMLQLVLSPMHVFVSDSYQRPAVDGVLREGHLSLSGLQMRAHAMFSAEGLPLGSETLEYAWLIDMQAGALTGKVTVPQMASLVEWGETFVFHVVSREFQLERPKSSIICQHGVDRRICEAKLASLPGPCRTSEDLKYTMTRLSVDTVDIFIAEHGCAANIKTNFIRLANCNLHNQAVGRASVPWCRTCRFGSTWSSRTGCGRAPWACSPPSCAAPSGWRPAAPTSPSSPPTWPWPPTTPPSTRSSASSWSCTTAAPNGCGSSGRRRWCGTSAARTSAAAWGGAASSGVRPRGWTSSGWTRSRPPAAPPSPAPAPRRTCATANPCCIPASGSSPRTRPNCQTGGAG